MLANSGLSRTFRGGDLVLSPRLGETVDSHPWCYAVSCPSMLAFVPCALQVQRALSTIRGLWLMFHLLEG
jgi:hypothetical protein